MKAWANIDTSLKTYTVHLDHDVCPHVTEMKYGTELGWKKQHGTGSWKPFRSKEEAVDIYDNSYKEKLTLIECNNCK
ncbi:hypothetical protein J34TS1_43850 [Paenibacillus azoreducens]|uniref:Uncharacterized protein n=1 Tax=Paenibacillus azoreducens TaxID=116718 RepID=A0A919YJ64_9BACL|nr:hypothetical protein J34TS1_43850 [Paenibacillus azoreducens]